MAQTNRTPSALRALFTQIMSFFAGTYAEVFSITEGPPLHDPLAISAAIYPEIFDDQGGERFQVDVVTEGVHSVTQSEVGELGRTKVTKLKEGDGGCRIPRGVDLASFWGSIESALKRADAISPMPKISREDLEKDGVFVGIN
jgi:uridine nucleosidase